MKFDLDNAIEKIKNNKDFLKLKNVVENNINHDNETTYDHCLRTYEVAKKNIDGNFITNKTVKKKFDSYINKQIGGIKKRDLMQITALIHDIGKIIVFDDSVKKRNLFIKNPDGTTKAPEHGYWGSLTLSKVLKNSELSDVAISYISDCVRLHLAGFEFWYSKNLNEEERLWEFKLRSENYHVEIIFNVYCDLYYGAGFKNRIHLPKMLLNNPLIYEPVNFSIIS